MYKDYRVAIVLPAYNASETLEQTVAEIPADIADDIILCDDASSDNTVSLAAKLGIPHILKHSVNLGYGGNQKSLYRKALDLDADIIIMVHPDYQYTPRLIRAMVSLIGEGVYHVVLASRILGNGALRGGMPRYKYLANRVLTALQNLLAGHKLSEYHTGYRAYKREVLESINFEQNSDDYIFDNQVLSQIIYKGYDIGEISCPTRYFEEASSIGLTKSVTYGMGVVKVSMMHLIQRTGLYNFNLYK